MPARRSVATLIKIVFAPTERGLYHDVAFKYTARSYTSESASTRPGLNQTPVPRARYIQRLPWPCDETP
jgi:hypothetical protein